jgi:uncharacterized protein YbbC (DUF1343 family)
MLKIKNTYNNWGVNIKLSRIKKKYDLFLAQLFCFAMLFTSNACTAQKNTSNIRVAANNTAAYIPLLATKNIAVVANQTSVIYKNSKQNSNTHLVDSLMQQGIAIIRVFSPEHGFRGKADAAEHVANGIDTKTGLPIISLYGKRKKPSAEDLKNIELVVFDIQDVGVRFYTYISTLHYVMEACAENNIPILVLDRPNPNGHYVDGPMLDRKHTSFVGMHPVPLVYGMTIGEYAQMINGERWLKNGLQANLTVIPLKNYDHKTPYNLPIRPSPNLPNATSINLYPSLGFFEGTTISAGRGTENQFQQFGAPWFPNTSFQYKPIANFGAKYPKHKNKTCNGIDLKNQKQLDKVNMEWLVDAYHKTRKANEVFFGKTFTVHAGNTKLQQQLEKGWTAKEIENSWKNELKTFKKTRKKYLLYE